MGLPCQPNVRSSKPSSQLRLRRACRMLLLAPVVMVVFEVWWLADNGAGLVSVQAVPGKEMSLLGELQTALAELLRDLRSRLPRPGERLLWVAVPLETEQLGPVAIAINVCYSFVPSMYAAFALLDCFWQVLKRWPSHCVRATWEAVESWSQEQRRQMRHVVSSLKILLFVSIFLAAAAAQGHSSLGSGAVEAICSIGLLTIFLIDIMICWTLRYLTQPHRGAEQPCYTVEQLERLGYSQSTTNEYVVKSVFFIVTLFPVPWARVIVGDATHMQALLFSLQGFVLALLLHISFIFFFRPSGGRRGEWIQRRLFIPMLQWRCLGCRGREELDSLPSAFGRGLSSVEEEFAIQFELLRTEHRSKLRQEREAFEERMRELCSGMPEELWQRRRGSSDAGDASGGLPEDMLETGRDATGESCFSNCWPLSWMETWPGLEFLSIRNDVFFHEFAVTERELEETELLNETLKSRLLEVNEDMASQELELHQQQQALAMQRQQTQELTRQASEQMLASKQHYEAESERLEKQRLEELTQKQREFEESMKHLRAEGEVQVAQERAKMQREKDELESRMQQEMLASLEAHVTAMEQAAKQVEMARLKGREEVAKAKAEHEEVLHRIHMESERAQAKHAESLLHMQQEADEAKRESARQVEVEKKRQGAFVQQLITSAQGMTKMIDAAKAGDRMALEVEYSNMLALQDEIEEDVIRQLAGPLLAQAGKTQQEWIRRLHDLSGALEKAKNYGGSDIDKLSQQARQLFGAVASAIDNGLRLSTHDTELCHDAEVWLFDRWLTSVSKNHLDPLVGAAIIDLQKQIIHKAVWASPADMGTFDFTDLEMCLETVDCSQKTFIELARVQVNHNSPRKLPRALSQLNSLIYFLNYIEREDLQKTKDMFIASTRNSDAFMGDVVQHWLRNACNSYDEENVLLEKADFRGIKDRKPADVIQQMSKRRCPALGKFHEIFCTLARVWEQDFHVLTVPHHSQVFALLIFKAFLEERSHVKTLIAQVSTGEGKSMLIAMLAIFVCLSKGKRAHVVGSDKKLVLRDFENFRAVFREFAASVAPNGVPDRFAVCCSDSKQAQGKADIVQSIPSDAWIVYCEARHATSFYTQKARKGELRQASEDDCVLILDEVDALIIDEDPTEDFVYDVSWRPLTRGMTVSAYATELGRYLARGQACPDELKPMTEEEKQLYCQLVRLFRQVERWHLKPKAEKDAEYQLYGGSEGSGGMEAGLTGLYVRMQNGKAAPHFQSNFLECLRLHEQRDVMGYKMKWYERLFVMSKPRVLQRYSQIIGLSGTIGDDWERNFLRNAYGAQFFIVPPFLQTCAGVQHHTAQWAGSEKLLSNGKLQSVSMHMGLPGPGVVAANAEDQYNIVEMLCFKVRKLVPVLVITASPENAELVVDRLRQHARGAIAGCNPSDLVRSLSQREYDRDPAMYKDGLRAATRTLSRSSKGPKEFRITVTDHTGARGTDYQMLDEDADKLGGLMLLVMHVPPSRRDWIQYKGRTARQNWRGQYCVVLNAEEYRALDQGRGESLPKAAYNLHAGARYVPKDPEKELVEHIMSYGAKESKRKLDKCEASYNAGFIANEICERVWLCPGWQAAGKADLKLEGEGRRRFLELCSCYRHMTASELEQQAAAIEAPAEAEEKSLSYDLEESQVPNRNYQPLPLPPGAAKRHKAVLFLMDISGSMTSHKIGPDQTRLGVCKVQLTNILTNAEIISSEDKVGVVAFGAGQLRLIPKSNSEIVRPVDQGEVKALMENGEFEAAQVQTRREIYPEVLRNPRLDVRNHKLGNFTFLYSALCAGIKDLMSTGDQAMPRWLILLCDGDDTGGGKLEGDCLEMLRSQSINLIIISVGSDVTRGSVLQGFADAVAGAGRIGKYIAAANEEDDSAVRHAFAQVEESLMLDEGGQTEASG
eukprot:TRINITY_DN106161_c0_g1_i1.p1 TRINITY_DN106161_c0_g1~~TRINITY_DN106161_c0_g1_i1.p1  ORF type:complete len:1910 (+),score=459.26 TRINITY_DN106161_c0_g1_i1:54-5783(+)